MKRSLIAIFFIACSLNAFSQEESTLEVVFEKPGKAADDDPDAVFTVVEETALPVGGMPTFYQYIATHVTYPAEAKKAGIQGRVFVKFIVEKDGSINEIEILKGIGGGCDEEAKRVIALSPKWIPGKQRGKPVRQKMVLPIAFSL